MGIAVAERGKYLAAIKRLFPQGEYWDAQFADGASDVSLFCEAKLPELLRFLERKSQLQNESRPETTEELIADWERVLLDSVSYGLDLNQRRLLLKSKQDVKLNRGELEKIAGMYGLSIAGVEFPFRAFFFGFTRLSERLGSFAAFSLLLVTAVKEGFRPWAWSLIEPDVDTGRFGRLHFGLERLAHFPARQLLIYFYTRVAQAGAGHLRLGRDRLFHLPLAELFEEAWAELRKGCFSLFHCGADRMVWYDGGFTRAVDAITAVSGVLPEFSGYLQAELLSETKFYERLESVMAKAMILVKRPFADFEQAVRDKLLANQTAYFDYGGE
ncbi:MAG: YmfQ family protein [Treponematales bacterium]